MNLSEAMKPIFDPVEFARRITDKMERNGLSLRDVQDASGVAHASLHRVKTGQSPNVENFIRLVRWLETT